MRATRETPKPSPASGGGPAPRPARAVAGAWACAGLVSLGAALFWLGEWHLHHRVPGRAQLGPKLTALPNRLGTWRAARASTKLAPELVKGFSEYQLRSYVSESAPNRPVDVFIRLYQGTFQDGQEHSPIICYEAGGWETTTLQEVAPPHTALGKEPLRWAVFEKDGERTACLFWYYLNGERVVDRVSGRWRRLAGMLTGTLVQRVVQVELLRRVHTDDEQELEDALELAVGLKAYLNANVAPTAAPEPPSS